MKNQYSISEMFRNVYSLIITKVFYPGARLVRRPIYVRGKKSLIYGKKFTTGYSCRFDLKGDKKTLFIGDNCQIGDNVHIVALDKVEIGDNCLMASKIFISDTSHGIYDNSDITSNPSVAPTDRTLHTKPVKIGNNVWIGENVVILAGVNIGDGSVIGANSVVTKSFPKNCIIVGTPATVIKEWNESEEKWLQK